MLAGSHIILAKLLEALVAKEVRAFIAGHALAILDLFIESCAPRTPFIVEHLGFIPIYD